MSTLTIILIIAFVLLAQFAPVYLMRIGVTENDEGEEIPTFYFTRTFLIHAFLIFIHHGFHEARIIPSRVFYEAYTFVEDELDTTSKNWSSLPGRVDC